MPTAFGYTRVSTMDQVKHGCSMEAQAEEIQEYYQRVLERTGYTLAPVITDPGVSAGKKNLLARPGGRRLWDSAKKGDVVLFTKLDRGFRNTKDCLTCLEDWTAAGVDVVILDIPGSQPGPFGKLMITQMAAFAEFSQAQRSERVAECKEAKRVRGEWVNGTVPFGFQIHTWNDKGQKRKHLVHYVQQRKWAGWALAKYEAMPRKNLQAIYEMINREGVLWPATHPRSRPNGKDNAHLTVSKLTNHLREEKALQLLESDAQWRQPYLLPSEPSRWQDKLKK